MTIRLGVQVSGAATDPSALGALAELVEHLGYDSLWTSEAYGSDAVAPLSWVAARTKRISLGTGIAQMAARTPAMTAMTAMTLDALSGGRFRLGLGASGPQVVEGWHGVPYGRPLVVTREYIEIVRAIVARERPLEFDGASFQVPYRGRDASGLGRPLKITLPPRPHLPIYLAAIGPKNVRLACEIADGLLPFFWSPTRWSAVYEEVVAGRRPGFDIAAIVDVAVGDDIEACRDALRPHFALYIGGMGAQGRNFYNDLITRYGYEAEASRIESLFLSGDRAGAARAVPGSLIDDLALVGPRGHIADQLEAWKVSPVSTLIVNSNDPSTLSLLADLVR